MKNTQLLHRLFLCWLSAPFPRFLFWGALLVLSVQPLFAVNECGPDLTGQDTITCSDTTHDNGIRYENSDGLTLILDNAAMVVGSPGVFLHGDTVNNGNITVNVENVNSVTAGGNRVHAIWAETANENGTATVTSTLRSGTLIVNSADLRTVGLFARNRGLGDAETQMDGGTIDANGTFANGVMSSHVNPNATGANTVSMNGGTINADELGLFSAQGGLGTALTVMNDGTINTTNGGGHGSLSDISNANNASTSTARMEDGDITTAGDDSAGIFARTSGTGATVAEMNGGTITTSGDASHGVYSLITNADSTATATATLTDGTVTVVSTGVRTAGAWSETNGLGSVLARMDGGEINATGDLSHGLVSRHTNANAIGTNTVIMTAGNITSASNGIATDNLGTGASLAQFEGGTINTTGNFGRGLLSNLQNGNSAATSTARMIGGDITTTGNNAEGIFVLTEGSGATLGEMSGGSITTSGTDAHGIRVRNGNASTALSTGTLTAGDITTSGANAHGIFVRSIGTGDAIVNATGGTINAGGQNAHGVFASSVGGDVQVTVNTQVAGGSDAGYAVRTETAAGQDSTIAINGSANIESAAGLAIFNDEGDSQTTIAAGAQVAGEIHLGDGSDTLDVAQGVDITNMTVLNGGDNADSADGSIDVLTLRNQNVPDAQNVPTMINWEIVNFNDSTLAADDLVAETLNVSNGSATLGGASAVDDVLGSTQDETIILGGNTAIANVLEGAGGEDTLSVLGDASVAGGVFGGGDGSDVSDAADGADTITINTTGAVQSVEGGAGGDTIDLLAGTVDLDVLGGGDDDTVTLNGATVTGNIEGGAGDDAFTWQSGTTAGFLGGDGSDTAEVTAAGYDGTQILDGGDDAEIGDGWIDQLTLRGLEITIGGNNNLINWETIIMNDMTVTTAGDLPPTGTTPGTGLFLNGGTDFDGSDTFTHGGNLSIDADSFFRGTGAGQGVYQVEGLANDGTVDLVDAFAGDSLTAQGDYSGSGSLRLDADFDQEIADTLVVGGDVANSTTVITVQNVEDPIPAPSSAAPSTFSVSKILLVNVTGTTVVGDFSLDGDFVVNGAFDYLLELEGSQWFLVPELNSSGAVSGGASSILLQAFTDLPTLEQRKAARQWVWLGDGTPENPSPNNGVWVRFSGDHRTATPQSNFGAYKLESDRWTAQTGIETIVRETETGTWLLGLAAQYTTVDADLSNPRGTGSVEATGYGTGLTATWHGRSGSYLDLQGQLNWIESDLATAANGSLIDGHDSTAQSLSIEVGRRIALSEKHAIIPQAQLSWGWVKGDQFTDSLGNEVEPGVNNSVIGRFGLAYNYQAQDAAGRNARKLYLVGNILPNISEDTKVRVAGVEITSENDPTLAEFGLGGSIAIRKNARLYAEGSYTNTLFNDEEDNEGYSFTVGMNIDL